MPKELASYLHGLPFARIVADQAKKEDAVGGEVVPRELLDPLVVTSLVVQQCCQPSDVIDASVFELLDNEQDETVDIMQNDVAEPEGQCQKDLLVEHIDWQDALDGVAMDFAEFAYFHVAERHARKVG